MVLSPTFSAMTPEDAIAKTSRVGAAGSEVRNERDLQKRSAVKRKKYYIYSVILHLICSPDCEIERT